MTKRARKHYSREFKIEAVKLATKPGTKIVQVARELDIDYSSLRRWIQQYHNDPVDAFPGHGRLKPHEDELRQLKRELERVKEERDILKKALAYFAEDQK